MILRKATAYFTSILMLSSIFITSCGIKPIEPQSSVSADTAEAVSEESAEAEEATEAIEAAESDKTVSGSEAKGDKNSAAKPVAGSDYPDKDYAGKIDDLLSASSAENYTKTRAADKKSGDIVDTSIYKNKGSIVKVSTEDHGSEGRIISDYYYDGEKVAFMRRYKTDIYGINLSFNEADLSDAKSEYTGEVKADADETLKEAAKNTGKTLLYGYVGDEQGGMLKNVTVKLRNVEGAYSDETVTDGDGYYTFNVPQKEDTYSLVYEYDGCTPGSLNDVHIIPGTPEYSLGRCFVAPEGQGIHETDVYLLNSNKKAPVSLKNGEYAAVLTSDDGAMSMRLVNTDDQKNESGTQIKFDPSKSKNGYALFVEDGTYISKDDMAGNIGRTYMTVTIYDKNGIVAAYREPSGRLGTLWKVCTIDNNGDIAISGLMYTDTKDWIGSK